MIGVYLCKTEHMYVLLSERVSFHVAFCIIWQHRDERKPKIGTMPNSYQTTLTITVRGSTLDVRF